MSSVTMTNGHASNGTPHRVKVGAMTNVSHADASAPTVAQIAAEQLGTKNTVPKAAQTRRLLYPAV